MFEVIKVKLTQIRRFNRVLLQQFVENSTIMDRDHIWSQSTLFIADWLRDVKSHVRVIGRLKVQLKMAAFVYSSGNMMIEMHTR